MAWREITDADVETVLSGPELEKLRSVAGASDGGDDDKLADIITQATNLARGHIEDYAGNKVGAAGTVPERTIFHALAIIRSRIMNRLGMTISAGRKEEADKAEVFFHRVSEGKVKIERPDAEDIVEEGTIPEIETVSGAETQSSREKLGGLY